MKILFMNYNNILPVNSGNRIRTWNFINSLLPNNEISFFCCNGKTLSEKEQFELKRYFMNIWFVNKKYNKKNDKFTDRLKNLNYFLRAIPWEIQGIYSAEVEEKFIEIIRNNNFDLIFLRYIFLAQYVFRNIDKIKSKVIIDLDDIETIKIKRLMNSGKFKFNGIYDMYRKFLNYNAFERFHNKLKYIDKCIVCSDKDREYVKSKRWTRNVSVIPNSINVFNYSMVPELEEKILENKIILFCGHLSYNPNVDGIEWFIKEVFPLILHKEPAVKLHIVGLNPKDEILKYSNGKSIFVFPNVSSVVKYYEECSLCIVPIRIAGGTRIKIIEALACKRPVVSTTVGAEGLNLVNKIHYLIQDKPGKFASECIGLLSLDNLERTNRLTRAGYEFVIENYDTDKLSTLILKTFS